MKIYIPLLLIFNWGIAFSQNLNTNIEYQLEKNDLLDFRYYENGYRLEKLYRLDNPKSSYIYTLKTDLQELERMPNKFLTESILKRLEAGEMVASNIENSKKILLEDIQKYYKTKTSNYKGRESRSVLVDRSTEINKFKIEQEWKFGKTDIELEIKSIIPIIEIEESGKKYRKELFKLEMRTNGKYVDDEINIVGNTWIKYSKDEIDIGQLELNESEFKKLKETLWEYPKENKIAIYDWRKSILEKTEPLPSEYFKKYVESEQVDTTISFDPQTYKSTITEHRSGGHSFDDLSGFILHQLWIWNDENSTLRSIVIGVTPLFKHLFFINLKNEKVMKYSRCYDIKFVN